MFTLLLLLSSMQAIFRLDAYANNLVSNPGDLSCSEMNFLIGSKSRKGMVSGNWLGLKIRH